jgi:hypothetical protein
MAMRQLQLTVTLAIGVAIPAVAQTVDVPLEPSRWQATDSVLNGRVTGSKVVYARTVITTPRAGLRRMHVGFSDGMVVYCNGVPL